MFVFSLAVYWLALRLRLSPGEEQKQAREARRETGREQAALGDA